MSGSGARWRRASGTAGWSGYFDLGTLYFGAKYETEHLPLPAALEDNITERFYETGHMIYLNEQALGRLHDDVATFVRSSEVPR